MPARSPALEGPSGLVIDVDRRLAWIHGVPVDLTRQEFDFLRVLLEDRGRVVPIRELGHRAWGYDTGEDKRLIYTAAWRVRRALTNAGAGDIIEGVRGVGYTIARSTDPIVDLPLPTTPAVVVFDGEDPNLRILFANDEAVDLSGYGREALLQLGNLNLKLWSPEDRAEIDMAVGRAMRFGRAETIGRTLLRADGSDVPVDIHLSRLGVEGRVLLVAEVWVHEQAVEAVG